MDRRYRCVIVAGVPELVSPAGLFFERFFASLIASYSAHRTSDYSQLKVVPVVGAAKEIEVSAAWTDPLQAVLPDWTHALQDWSLVTPGGVPPWLVTLTEWSGKDCRFMHFAIPAPGSWASWVELLSPEDLPLASAALLEFSLNSMWQEASQLPQLAALWSGGAAPPDIWQTVALLGKEGADPTSATVAACRL